MRQIKEKTRTQKAKLNMVFSLLQQGITFICGLIIPSLMINTYGSETYGATTSIATFLSYITLLEGGIGAVTRSALYKAFARKSNDQICAVVSETKIFYRKIAYAFVIYVLIIALMFKQISHNTVFAFWYSFGLVIVIAFSTFAEYFFGISYSLLLQADQMNYIVVVFKTVTTILNTICVVVLVVLKCDIFSVKLLSSIVFVIRPILLSIYVKKRYHIKIVQKTEKLLVNKGSAIGQHIAWALHNNTDIAVLTVFKDLTYVSVYSVYSMITSQLQNILNSFSSGMEAVFGSMYSNKEKDKLEKIFGHYETLVSILSVTVFSVASILIVPFIRIYTSRISDAQYIDSSFAILIIIASLLYSLRTPYGHMIIAAGRYKETRMAAYGEAIINISASILFVILYGLAGVAIGTALATLFRYIYYAIYLSKHVMYRRCSIFLKRLITNMVSFLSIYFIGNFAISRIVINDYFVWALTGAIVSIIVGIIIFTVNILLYKDDVLEIITRGLGKHIQK